MKGVVLAGGLGTRLRPLTDVTNKHLLPVWDKPMIYYPLQLMSDCGINDVMVVVGGQSTGEVVRLCKDGRQFGLRGLNYAYQEGEGGIAAALRLAMDFVRGDQVFVVLGDNIVLDRDNEVRNAVIEFSQNDTYAEVFIKRVGDVKNYGCATFCDTELKRIKKIYEKPADPPTDFAVLGMYLYEGPLLEEALESCKPSARGELEITDVNNLFAHGPSSSPLFGSALGYHELTCYWGDAGESFEKYYEVSSQVRWYQEYGKVKETK